jgi:hypothetical protein
VDDLEAAEQPMKQAAQNALLCDDDAQDNYTQSSGYEEAQVTTTTTQSSGPGTPVEVKLARLGLDSNKMMVVTSPIKKRMPIKNVISRPVPPVQGNMPWWADWAVYFCGLPAH